MYYIGRILGFVVLAAAAVWSVWLARADAEFSRGTPEGVARAMELLPGNTEYLAFGALQAEYDGRDAEPLFRRIVQLNSTLSAPRIRLGLAAEQRGDAGEAERQLREAYSVDHQFETRWTLANFYFRQGRVAEFWMWMRSALEVSYGDRRPAFDLCWRMSSDADEILQAIPDREDVAADYLAFLMNRPEALAAAVRKVNRPELLLAATDVLLEAKRYADAVEVWKQAGRSAPVGVTSPGFEAPQTGHGFDWRWNAAGGVKHPAPARIQLTGAQPETVELVRQYVGGLRPGARYKLQWTAAAKVPGLEWRVNGGPADFRADAEVAVLALWYERPKGEVRAEAQIDIGNVQLLLDQDKVAR